METNNRRDFLKKAALAGASALVAPSLFATGEEGSEISILKNEENGLENNLIVPKNNGLKITGTFLDEISHVENIKSLDPLLYSKLTHQKNIRIK